MTKITVAGAVIAVAFSGLTLQGRLTASSAADAQAAKASTQPSIKPDDLDKLLAPVALYPDQLLAQMLLCAQKPGKVGALNEWLASQTLKGSELQDAATKSGFEPSFVALALFPEVVNIMATQPTWTSSWARRSRPIRKAVFASIQRLRQKAKDSRDAQEHAAAGGRDQDHVERRAGDRDRAGQPAGRLRAAVQPAGRLHAAASRPSSSRRTTPAEAVAAGLIGFTAGIAIGAAIDNDYYYGPYGWHGGVYMYNDAWDD